MYLDAVCPGNDYIYEIGEKDPRFGQKGYLRFDSVELRLHPYMPQGTVIADFFFYDAAGTKVEVPAVDLMKFIPQIETRGEMAYAEVLEEEYNRFGYSFRREHDEFFIEKEPGNQGILPEAYRLSITNNCLAPTKFEFGLTSADFSDFEYRVMDQKNLNQNRILAHTWFYLDSALYQTLWAMKNPGLLVNPTMEYGEMSDLAEARVIDYEQMRLPLNERVNIEVLEIGHKTNRPVKPLDTEEYFKREAWLLIDSLDYTYASILESTVRTAQFKDRGFYKTDTPREFDFSWMKHLDQVELHTIDVPGSKAYTEIRLTGKWTPYEIVLGNMDLSLLSEQKLTGRLFGVNTYPKSRRHNPQQNTRAYDAELTPDHIKPYLFMTTKDESKWVNNQYKGVEKVLLSYESLEKDILEIYVLSYERITPVWMARVKLPDNFMETIRIRQKLYSN